MSCGQQMRPLAATGSSRPLDRRRINHHDGAVPAEHPDVAAADCNTDRVDVEGDRLDDATLSGHDPYQRLVGAVADPDRSVPDGEAPGLPPTGTSPSTALVRASIATTEFPSGEGELESCRLPLRRQPRGEHGDRGQGEDPARGAGAPGRRARRRGRPETERDPVCKRPLGLGVGPQDVAGSLRLDRGAAVRLPSEPLSQPRNVGAHPRRGLRRRLLTPDGGDEPLARDEVVRVLQQQGEHGPLLRTAQHRGPDAAGIVPAALHRLGYFRAQACAVLERIQGAVGQVHRKSRSSCAARLAGAPPLTLARRAGYRAPIRGTR